MWVHANNRKVTRHDLSLHLVIIIMTTECSTWYLNWQKNLAPLCSVFSFRTLREPHFTLPAPPLLICQIASGNRVVGRFAVGRDGRNHRNPGKCPLYQKQQKQ